MFLGKRLERLVRQAVSRLKVFRLNSGLLINMGGGPLGSGGQLTHQLTVGRRPLGGGGGGIGGGVQGGANGGHLGGAWAGGSGRVDWVVVVVGLQDLHLRWYGLQPGWGPYPPHS